MTKRRRRADTMAIDLGTSRCGVAALFRRYSEDEDGRFGYHSVETWSVDTLDLAYDLEELRPRTVLVEEATPHSDVGDEALDRVKRVCKKLGAPVCTANVSTWKREAAGSHRTNPAALKALAIENLRRLGVSKPRALFRQASEDRDERAALVLLACWQPTKAVLARGRSPTVFELSPSALLPGSSQVRRCSKGGQRLYGAMYEAAKARAQPGQRLLCKAARISPGNYKRYLKELVETLEIEVVGKRPYDRIVL